MLDTCSISHMMPLTQIANISAALVTYMESRDDFACRHSLQTQGRSWLLGQMLLAAEWKCQRHTTTLHMSTKQEARVELPHPRAAMKQEAMVALPHPCAAHSTEKAVMVLDVGGIQYQLPSVEVLDSYMTASLSMGTQAHLQRAFSIKVRAPTIAQKWYHHLYCPAP